MTVAANRFNNDLRYREGDHPAQTQFTPRYVLDPVRVDLGGVIGLDPCTTDENPVEADEFYTPEQDGLTCPWHFTYLTHWFPSVYVNPPYSKAREPWVEKCIEAGARGQKVILLIPAATDTRIFQKAVTTSTAVVFVKGRVKFGVLRPNRRQVAASHPSALIGWNTDLAACSALGILTAGVAGSPETVAPKCDNSYCGSDAIGTNSRGQWCLRHMYDENGDSE